MKTIREMDLKPTQMEAPEWLFSRFYDQDGYVTEPLSIFLTMGKHDHRRFPQRADDPSFHLFTE